MESLARIIFPEICSDKSWKLTEIFYFYQIDTGIKIFNNNICKVNFGFEYMFVCMYDCKYVCVCMYVCAYVCMIVCICDE